MSDHQMPPRGPDYSMGVTLRGYKNFEDIYQGMSRQYPIALSRYGSITQGRDAAAKQNYDILSPQLAQQGSLGPAADGNVDGATSPNLLAGEPCTYGANTTFFLPRLFGDDHYTYQIVWRTRTPAIFDKNGLPYHMPEGDLRYQDGNVNTQNGWKGGQPVFTGKAAERAIIMSTTETVRMPTTPDETDPLRDLSRVQAKDIGIVPFECFGYPEILEGGDDDSEMRRGPLLPFVGGRGDVNPTTGKTYVAGEYGQSPLSATMVGGVSKLALQQIAPVTRNGVSMVSYTTKAKGDEFVVLLWPSVGGGSTYDFDGGLDFYVSVMFGRGGYVNGARSGKILYPDGLPFGVVVIQGYD
jgi:hypothetical protein